MFIESKCELVNFITVELLETDFVEKFHTSSTSENLKIIALKEFEDNGRRMVSLDNLVQWASYEAQIPENNLVNKTLGILNFEDLRYTVEKCLSSSDLFVEKKTKKVF